MFGGISNVKKFYRMLIEKAWEEAETTKDARIMAAAKEEISKAVTILEVIEKAATGTTSSEKTVTEKAATEEFPEEKPPDEELATEKPDVGVKGVDEKMAEVVEKDTLEESLPTPPPLVVESLSDPMLATDDLEEPQPPPVLEARAHLSGAEDHQDVDQGQDLPAQGLNVDDDRDEVNAKRVQDGAGEVRVPPPLHPVEPALPYQPGDDPFSPLSNFPCGHTKRYI